MLPIARPAPKAAVIVVVVTVVVVVVVVVIAVPVVTGIWSAEDDRTIQTEGNNAFRRHPHLTASRCGLADSTRARTCQRADGGSFAAAGNSANNGPNQRTAAHVLTGSAVGADT